MKLAAPINYLIRVQEARRYHFSVFFLFCLFTGLVRGLEEMLFFSAPEGAAGLAGLRSGFRNSQMVTFIPFYLSVGVALTVLLSKTTGLSFRRVNPVVWVGLFLGIFPPLIDLALSGPGAPVRYAYYIFWNPETLPWLGYSPEMAFPAGEAITIWLSVFFCGYYVWRKTRRVARVLLVLVLAWASFLTFSSFLPMVVTRFLAGVVPDANAMAGAGNYHVWESLLFQIAAAQVLVAQVIYLLAHPGQGRILLQRLPHILPFLLIALLGALEMAPRAGATGWGGMSGNWMLILLFFLGAIASWQNDYFDGWLEGAGGSPRHHGRLADGARGPDRQDLYFWEVSWLLAWFLLFVQGFKFCLPLLVVYGVSVLYHYPFYRGKRRFLAATKIEAVWGAGAFLAGALTFSLPAWPPGVLLLAFLVFGGWSLLALLKDEKDILSDSRAGNISLYVLALRRGIPPRRVLLALRVVVLLAVLVPVLWYGFENRWWGFTGWSLAAAGMVVLFQWRLNRARFRLFLGLVCLALASSVAENILGGTILG